MSGRRKTTIGLDGATMTVASDGHDEVTISIDDDDRAGRRVIVLRRTDAIKLAAALYHATMDVE